MITEVTIENFKAHAKTDVRLEPFTVLVGANGVGKTSVLEALHLLGQSTRTPMLKLLRGPWRPERVLRDHAREAVLSASHTRADGGTNRVTLRFQAGGASKGTVDPGALTFDHNQGFDTVQRAHPLVKDAASVVMLRLDSRAVARTGYVEPGGPRVEHDGANTAAVLASWKLDDDARLQAVTAALRELVPQVRAIRVRPAPAKEDARDRSASNGYNLALDFDDARNVAAMSVSEGTLVALAILTLLHAAPQPRLVLLDDLGAELHPTAQLQLVEVLQGIQRQNPNLQIVATTHSPFILDALQPNNVRVFARGDDGAARVRSLAAHPDAGRADLTTGQLWTMDPESWVIEGQEP